MKGYRGQTGAFNLLIFSAVLLAVVATVLVVGADVASEFAEGINANQSEFEQAEENITTVCNGVFGCGEQNPLHGLFQAAGVLMAILLMVGFVGFLSGRAGTGDPSQPDGPDKITLIKQRYMDDEIQTTVKLEKELEDHVEPYLDDSDVQEIDDLLHGDDSDE